MKIGVATSKQLGTECWSTIRLLQHDCTKCRRLKDCSYTVKGIYPNQKPKALFEAQLKLKRLKGKLTKHFRTDIKGE